MAITIEHTYCTPVYITYYTRTGKPHTYANIGMMDDIAEIVCDTLCKHEYFIAADVLSRETGEVLMKIQRS